MIYRVVIDCESKLLSTILSLIDGNPEIRLVTVTDASAPSLPPAPLPPQPAKKELRVWRYVGGKKDKGVRGEDVIANVLRSGPADMAELRRVFANHNYSPTSAPSYVSRLIKQGKIKRGLHGRFALVNGASA
jgi:hypothetical protein